VLADIPGLIEGAAEGAGLGVRFLGHVERCAVLIHLVDSTQDDVAGAWRTVRAELAAYGEGLAEKPELTALAKVDALTPALRQARARELEAVIGHTPFEVSSASGEGVTVLLRAALSKVREAKAPAQARAEAADWRP
jgi:GTP-binding protein